VVVAALVVRPLPEDGSLPLPAAGVVPLVGAAALASWHWALVPIGALVLTVALAAAFHARRIRFLGAALPVSVLAIAAWAGLDVIARRYESIGPLWPGAFGLVVLVAVARDVAGELAFRAEHGAVVRAGVVASLAEAERAQARLLSLELPVFVRSAHHRALWHFFGPHLSLELLVPAAHAERVAVLMAHGLVDPDAGATAVAPVPPSSRPAEAPRA
jgi:hypothetical protein